MTMQIFYPLINQVVCFLVIELQIFLIVGCKSFIRYVIYIYFLPVCGLLSHSLSCFFAEKNVKFDEVKFISFFPLDCAFSVLSKKTLPNQDIKVCLLFFFFSRQCYALSFSFMSVIHFRLIFIYDASYRSRVLLLGFGFFTYGSPVIPASFVKRFIFSLPNCLCIC